MGLRFATFFSAPPETRAFHPHTDAQTTRDETVAMINMLFMSAARFNRGAKFAVITCERTDLSGVDLPFLRFETPVGRDTLMYDRMVGQHRLVRNLSSEDTVVLVDTDIVVQADLSHLATDETDVAVTWRRATIPINGGLLVARNRGGNRAATFFDQLLTTFRRSHDSARQWNGDQLALRELLPTGRQWLDDVVLSPAPGLRVRLLPSDIYNYSPPDDPSAYCLEEHRHRAVLHFKGRRKRFMSSYCDALLRDVAAHA